MKEEGHSNVVYCPPRPIPWGEDVEFQSAAQFIVLYHSFHLRRLLSRMPMPHPEEAPPPCVPPPRLDRGPMARCGAC